VNGPCATRPSATRPCATQGRPSLWGRLRATLLTALALIACLSLLTGAAPPQADVDEAQRLFKAGALAYKLGKFSTAVQAFEQAHDLAPNPALRFSAAQALRRQYAADGRRQLLDAARRYYDEYLRKVGQGRRRLDAAKAIEHIDLLLAANHPSPAPVAPASSGSPDGGAPPIAEPPAPVPPPPAPPGPETSIIVESPIVGARVSVDDGKPAKAPLIRDLAPGRHRLRVTAPGYRPMERAVVLMAGKVKSLDVSLEELPATLTIHAPPGLELVIDGRPMGTTPRVDPIELGSGTHRVVAGQNGHYPFAQAVSVDRGQAAELDVEMEMTTQRIISWILFTGAGVAAAGSLGLTIAALSDQSEAKDILQMASQEKRPLTVAEAEDHNGALSRRDNFKRFAGITVAAAALAGGIGLLTYFLDEPQLYGVELSDDGDDAGDEQTVGRGLSVSGSAVVLPTGFAAGLTVHF
jgi:hypothetical protein